jgi:stress response protein YsnF
VAVVGWGIPEEDAKFYEGEVKAGAYLVTVDRGNDDARAVLTRHGGRDRAALQLNKEQLKVSKTPVQTAEVGVRKEVVTVHRQVTVPVEREEV